MKTTTLALGNVCADLTEEETTGRLWEVLALTQTRAHCREINSREVRDFQRSDLWPILDSLSA